jgi:glycerate 2-kinase
MRVLLAFDKFKDALSAREACDTAAHALRERHRDWTLDLCPLTDGGEGFCEILTAAAGGHTIVSSVTGPRGDLVQAPIGVVTLDKIPPAARALLALPADPQRPKPALGVIDTASASGLALLEPADRDPWETTSFGTGELLKMAADLGVSGVLLGVGGSATNDLGLGALAALGLDFLTARDDLVDPPIPARWTKIAHLDGALPSTLPPIRIACDVSNPLLGARGAAAVYGPQKGLRETDRRKMEHEMARLALLLCHHTGQPDTLMDAPGTGAAGGISFGLMAAARAQLLPGFDLVSAWLDLETKLAAADIVITGEGRFDESSLEGKGPGAVASRALALGKTVHVFAGTASGAARDRLTLHSITPAGVPLPQALLRSRELLLGSVAQVFSR